MNVEIRVCNAQTFQGVPVCGMQGKMFRLAEVRVLPERGADPLLELADAATLCFVVRDDSTCLPDQAQGPVSTAFPVHECQSTAADRQPWHQSSGGHRRQGHVYGSPSRQQQAAEETGTVVKHSSSAQRATGAGDIMESAAEAYGEHTRSAADHGEGAGNSCPGRTDANSADACASIAEGASRWRAKEQIEADVSYREGVCLRALEADASTSDMDPETERGVVLCLFAECQAALQQLPTTASQDEALLRGLCSRSAEYPAMPTGEGDIFGLGDAIKSNASGHDCSECVPVL